MLLPRFCQAPQTQNAGKSWLVPRDQPCWAWGAPRCGGADPGRAPARAGALLNVRLRAAVEELGACAVLSPSVRSSSLVSARSGNRSLLLGLESPGQDFTPLVQRKDLVLPPGW